MFKKTFQWVILTHALLLLFFCVNEYLSGDISISGFTYFTIYSIFYVLFPLLFLFLGFNYLFKKRNIKLSYYIPYFYITLLLILLLLLLFILIEYIFLGILNIENSFREYKIYIIYSFCFSTLYFISIQLSQNANKKMIKK